MDDQYTPGFLERECPGLVRQIEESSGLLVPDRNPQSAIRNPKSTQPCIGCQGLIALPTVGKYSWALCTDCASRFPLAALHIMKAIGQAAYASGLAVAQESIELRDRHVQRVLRSRAGWRATAHVVAAAGILVALAILYLWRAS